MISGEPLRVGTYELSFHIGAYFAGLRHAQPADPPFLDVVPIRFGEQVFALAHEPKQFVRFSEGGHENLDTYGALDTAHRFINGAGR